MNAGLLGYKELFASRPSGISGVEGADGRGELVALAAAPGSWGGLKPCRGASANRFNENSPDSPIAFQRQRCLPSRL